MKKQFQFIANRGDQGRFVENSQLAVVSSWIDGYIPEVNVRRTKDGVFVLFHDSHLMRVTNAPKNLSELSIEYCHYKDLEKLHLLMKNRPSGWQKIPSLDSILRLMKTSSENQLILDIKSGAHDSIFQEIEKKDLLSRVIFSSRQIKDLEKIKAKSEKPLTLLHLECLQKEVHHQVKETLKLPSVDGVILSFRSFQERDIANVKPLFDEVQQTSKHLILHLYSDQHTMLSKLFQNGMTNIATDNIPLMDQGIKKWLEV